MKLSLVWWSVLLLHCVNFV